MFNSFSIYMLLNWCGNKIKTCFSEIILSFPKEIENVSIPPLLVSWLPLCVKFTNWRVSDACDLMALSYMPATWLQSRSDNPVIQPLNTRSIGTRWCYQTSHRTRSPQSILRRLKLLGTYNPHPVSPRVLHCEKVSSPVLLSLWLVSCVKQGNCFWIFLLSLHGR